MAHFIPTDQGIRKEAPGKHIALSLFDDAGHESPEDLLRCINNLNMFNIYNLNTA